MITVGSSEVLRYGQRHRWRLGHTGAEKRHTGQNRDYDWTNAIKGQGCMHITSEVFLSLAKLSAKPQVNTNSDKTNVSAFTPNIMKAKSLTHNEL